MLLIFTMYVQLLHAMPFTVLVNKQSFFILLWICLVVPHILLLKSHIPPFLYPDTGILPCTPAGIRLAPPVSPGKPHQRACLEPRPWWPSCLPDLLETPCRQAHRPRPLPKGLLNLLLLSQPAKRPLLPKLTSFPWISIISATIWISSILAWQRQRTGSLLWRMWSTWIPELHALQQEVKVLQEKALDTENRLRRNNLRILGLREKGGERETSQICGNLPC